MTAEEFLTIGVIILGIWLILIIKSAGIQITKLNWQDPVAIPIVIDFANGQYLCYNFETRDFVCQGPNPESIIRNFAERFPRNYIAIVGINEDISDIFLAQFRTYQQSNMLTDKERNDR